MSDTGEIEKFAEVAESSEIADLSPEEATLLENKAALEKEYELLQKQLNEMELQYAALEEELLSGHQNIQTEAQELDELLTSEVFDGVREQRRNLDDLEKQLALLEGLAGDDEDSLEAFRAALLSTMGDGNETAMSQLMAALNDMDAALNVNQLAPIDDEAEN